jgi:cation transport regulator ChaC
MSDTTPPKKGSFLALHEDGMRNGSVYRITGKKKNFAAQYVNGDFIQFVSEVPADRTFVREKKEALKLLPACFH